MQLQISPTAAMKVNHQRLKMSVIVAITRILNLVKLLFIKDRTILLLVITEASMLFIQIMNLPVESVVHQLHQMCWVVVYFTRKEILPVLQNPLQNQVVIVELVWLPFALPQTMNFVVIVMLLSRLKSSLLNFESIFYLIGLLEMPLVAVQRNCLQEQHQQSWTTQIASFLLREQQWKAESVRIRMGLKWPGLLQRVKGQRQRRPTLYYLVIFIIIVLNWLMVN